MLEEAKSKQDSDSAEFKNTMFAHAFVNQNPDLYKKIYPDDFGMSFEEEMEEIEWMIPESEEEAMALFNMAQTDVEQPDDSWRALPLLVESPSE